MVGDPLAGGLYGLYGVAFSPDGSTLASVGDFGLRSSLGRRVPAPARRAASGSPGQRPRRGIQPGRPPAGHRRRRRHGPGVGRRLAAAARGADQRHRLEGSWPTARGESRACAASRSRREAPSWRPPARAVTCRCGISGRVRALSRAITGHRGWVRGVAFTSDGAPVSGGVDRTLQFGALAADLRPARRSSPSPRARDGRIVAVAGNDGLLQLYDARTHQPLGRPLRGHTGAVGTAAFDADGRTLASGGDDGTVRLWDVERRRAIGAPIDLGAGAGPQRRVRPGGIEAGDRGRHRPDPPVGRRTPALDRPTAPGPGGLHRAHSRSHRTARCSRAPAATRRSGSGTSTATDRSGRR